MNSVDKVNLWGRLKNKLCYIRQDEQINISTNLCTRRMFLDFTPFLWCHKDSMHNWKWIQKVEKKIGVLQINGNFVRIENYGIFVKITNKKGKQLERKGFFVCFIFPFFLGLGGCQLILLSFINLFFIFVFYKKFNSYIWKIFKITHNKYVKVTFFY